MESNSSKNDPLMPKATKQNTLTQPSAQAELVIGRQGMGCAEPEAMYKFCSILKTMLQNHFINIIVTLRCLKLY
jgi:hypothetical protein